jgi:hypothetical protein
MRHRPLPSAAEAADILARKRTRPPAPPAPRAAKSLSPYLKSLEARFGKGPSLLQSRWREIVADERLARFTEPVKLVKIRGGAASVLELKVEGPAAAIVQHQVDEIIQRVNLVLGEGAVERLRILQGRVRPPAAGPAPPRRSKPRPLDAADEQALAASFAAAPDSPLKEALIRLGRDVLRREAERAQSPRPGA